MLVSDRPDHVIDLIESRGFGFQTDLPAPATLRGDGAVTHGRILLVMRGSLFVRKALQCYIETELRVGPVVALERLEDAAPDEAENPRMILLYLDAETEKDDGAVSRQIAEMLAMVRGAPVAVLSERRDPSLVALALRSGAHGCIPLSTPVEQFRLGLLLIAERALFVPDYHALPCAELLTRPRDLRAAPDAPAALALRAEMVAKFTPRELDVLKQLSMGLQNKLIAYHLGLQDCTVKVHMRHIIKKLRVTSRTQAALIAREIFAQAEADGRNDGPGRADHADGDSGPALGRT